ncbi:FAD-dependent oxidoreductase [Streptomyces sp. N2-109]|uniref:FAD-dependent oxidoreductase n=1 Tax=Streptomyces gossypii TaxID=2883101 RepID=A0ABT2K035_9ACTN|nr:FAD-dependent oxidoreductase [Streptomyces gossypii]MCT2593534.1 FAD-dependent oxidoreductase [Streptomyces gossypii]
MSGPTRAVVLGAGLTGTLAAAALSRQLDQVTLVDGDLLPAGPQPRKGVPQARHAHLLWSGGARAVESLLPGTEQRLLDAGARKTGMPDGLVSLSPQGWLRRWPQMQYLFTCTRDLLDWTVREQVLARPGIELRQGCQAEELLGSATRITGVRLRDRHSGTSEDCQADLVVDATGRGSRAPHWLADLGLPPVTEQTVDSGLAYATRLFRAPPGLPADFPVVNVQADPHADRPGQTATLLTVEGGKWLVTLSGTRGGEPPAAEGDFVSFARAVRHPVVGDLIAGAEPLGPVRTTRSSVNRRRFYERLPHWPDGFIVLGDAVATYNPVYGHGMSVAAQGAVALGYGLDRHDPAATGTARRLQRALARTVECAWTTATTQDVLYPEAVGEAPRLPARILQRYMDRLMVTANARPAAADALFEALTLSGPMTRLVSPRAAFATLLGPGGGTPLPGPPLTAAETRAARVR